MLKIFNKFNRIIITFEEQEKNLMLNIKKKNKNENIRNYSI